MRYLLCISIVLVQPYRLVGIATPLQLARQRDSAPEMLDREVGAGQTADEADGRNGFTGVVERAQGILIDGAAIPAKAHRTVDHADPFHLGERGYHGLQRERAE